MGITDHRYVCYHGSGYHGDNRRADLDGILISLRSAYDFRPSFQNDIYHYFCGIRHISQRLFKLCAGGYVPELQEERCLNGNADHEAGGCGTDGCDHHVIVGRGRLAVRQRKYGSDIGAGGDRLLCFDPCGVSGGDRWAYLSRFQKIGLLIMVIFFAAGGGVLGALIAMNLKGGISLDFRFANVLLYTAAAAAVVWILDIIISRRLLAGLEAR